MNGQIGNLWEMQPPIANIDHRVSIPQKWFINRYVLPFFPKNRVKFLPIFLDIMILKKWFYGTLEEMLLAPSDDRKKTSQTFLERCEYHVALEMDFGLDEPLGVKVKNTQIAYFANDRFKSSGKWLFTIGQRVIAPLEPVKEGNDPMFTPQQTILYPGFVIEVPKPESVNHGNKDRLLIFFECGAWRYVQVLLFIK